MVARISAGKSIKRMVNYNELKLQQGKAELIDAVHFGKEAEDLSFKNKLHRFEMLQERNQNVKTNAVHISLNFDISEKPEREKLQQIAAAYMEKIGFGEQPYLVYQHFDAGHPHIHIVTTNVQASGMRIDLHNIGRNQSEQARKEIELEFKLVQAEGRNHEKVQELQPVNARRIKYGQVETKKAIANVLNTVIDSYKYTSLHELNAVLRLYNVVADRGTEDSRIYQKRGLVYRVLDENGNKIGVPIKASAFHNKPTLNNLEKKFALNEVKREEFKRRVKVAIDFALFKPGQSIPGLIKALQNEQINTLVRQNEEGRIYGITCIDHKTRCVYNGSDLGKQYSAKGIVERCSTDLELKQSKIIAQKFQNTSYESTHHEDISKPPKEKILELEQVLHQLLKPEQQGEYLPNEFKKKRKRSQRQSR